MELQRWKEMGNKLTQTLENCDRNVMNGVPTIFYITSTNKIYNKKLQTTDN